MKTLDKYNKNKKQYDVNIKELEFKKIEEVFKENDTFQLKGIFMNTKSRGGISFSFITSKYVINAKPHMFETLGDMYSDDDVTRMINNGDVYIRFTPFEYDNEFNKGTSYSVEFLETEDLDKELDELNEEPTNLDETTTQGE